MSNLNQIESCNDYSRFSSRPRFCGHPHGASRPPTPWCRISRSIFSPRPRRLLPASTGRRSSGPCPGSEFLFAIPASGDRPMTFAAEGLPKGLSLDPSTGFITGRVKKPGTYLVKLTARNALGEATRELRIVIGERIALTPPMGWKVVELLGARRHAGASPLLGSCDDRVGAREPRLDVHQHRRRLAGPARRPLQRHPDQRQVPLHEGALGAGTRHGTQTRHLPLAWI